MAKKDTIGRLTLDKDLFLESGFELFLDLVFALTDNENVVIISKIAFDHLTSQGENLQFLGNCTMDNYFTFNIPDNVDTALGKGDDYFFTVIKKSTQSRNCSMICIRKKSSEIEDNFTSLRGISNDIKKLYNGLEAYLSEDIDD